MLKKKLVFIEQFDSEFKGNKYKLYTFLEPNLLMLIYGTDLKVDDKLVPGTIYDCSLDVKGKKIKVSEVN